MAFSLITDSERGNNKKRIIKSFFYNLNSTIPELAKEMNVSIPTITKLVNEMVEEGILNDYGKSESDSLRGDVRAGRRPCTYGLNPSSGYFLGVEIRIGYINIGICNFNGELVRQEYGVSCVTDTQSKEELNEICNKIKDFIEASGIPTNKILNACVTIGGRINPSTGYSYSNFSFAEPPLADMLSEKLGLPVCIDNDTRAMTYGEALRGCIDGEKNVLFINFGWGLGLGMIINGELYEGKSGFAGEFGHTHVFDNEILCHCGKKGCLETEVSGQALHKELMKEMADGKVSTLSNIAAQGGSISLTDIVNAINAEDFLCIDLMEKIGEKLGKQIANLINIFNPELVILGGIMADAGDYLLQPVKLAIKKHSLKLVNSDSKIVCSKMAEQAGVIGACMTARRQMFEKSN